MLDEILAVTGATIVTCDAAMSVTPDGAMVVADGRIVAVGPAASVSVPAGARIVDGRDRILMPGLINMHCHAGDSLFRGLVEDLAARALAADRVEGRAGHPDRGHLPPRGPLGLAELALQGVTTVMDMFWHIDETVAAAREIGLRVATGGIFFDPARHGRQATPKAAARAPRTSAAGMPAIHSSSPA
jgi:5-methylthioadenosine/S-adenosylhomocysteine deaminase